MEVVDMLGLVAAGLGVGFVFGVFGAGGSAFATPVLVLLGLPAPLAIATPLPAVLPASMLGARRSLAAGTLDRRLARLAVIGGGPGVVVGALASGVVEGQLLVVLSGLMLLVVGGRVLLPDPADHGARCSGRREDTALVITATFLVGVLTGLLANGGGLLLVPLFIVALGLRASEASGTSMVAVGVLTIPTLVAHWAMGHIDWPVALVFAAGVIPASLLGATAARHLPPTAARKTFGTLLVAFAAFFLLSHP